MTDRGKRVPAWPRAAAALAVAILTTLASLRLFFGGPPEPPAQELIAAQPDFAASDELGVAGGPVGEFLEAGAEDSAQPAPEPIVVRATLERNVGLLAFLRGEGLSRADASYWAKVFQSVSHDWRLRSGHLLSLYRDPESGDLRGLRYDADERVALVEQSYGNGLVLVAQRPITYFVRPVSIAFAIKDGFALDSASNDVPRSIANELEDAFSSKRPLGSLSRGATIKLLYEEQVSRDGTHTLIGDLKAAQVQVGTRKLHAFAFRDEHGRPHLYDDQGRPLGPQFLRFPLPFEYISSGFAAVRYHPILHRYRPHVGIDLVAQYGTPVKAIADGKVESSGWDGELGQCVRLAHDRDLVSIYGHLSRLSPDAREGSYVRVGQVIGYVGSTGLSTGPHLHFALFKNGSYINPLTMKLGANHEVSPRVKGLFDSLKREYLAALSKLPDLGTTFVPTADRKPAISRFGDAYHVQLKTPRNIRRHSIRFRHRAQAATASLDSGGL